MTISVNGAAISSGAIDREVQYHPAPTLEEARFAAARALVVRHLLLAEAGRAEAADNAADDAEEEAAIQAVLSRAITLPDPDEDTCRRYYANNPDRFRSPDIFEACHILFPARPGDEAARTAARQKALDTIRILTAEPERFAELALTLSACPSGAVGGSLGQVSRGQTTPELETFFYNLMPGTLCPVPVPTPYGYHVLRLDRRAFGRPLPFEVVHATIAAHLRQASWQRAVHQYVSLLVGQARIDGIDLGGATSPLVQ
ncbi:peptidyl-prolyl cis-trans isomerase C [Azospirillum fermentarium]|uniref:peptidylprolyl isomerase n=1 Tax=Azospirillum fermentarium TaxID=1233114 RepID=UPI002225B70C|nr:peptidylprolyl isomerase [Azospirillum fermentarium]MCW2248990.1 peptidyl-prolyl cis-trans isomerase C [Azospirillum fermentarium]